MRKFKLYDYRINVFLLVSAVIYGFVIMDIRFLLGYFVVGGWQIISMLVHYYKNWFTEKTGSRILYQRAVLTVLLISLAGFIFGPILFVTMILLLFTAPIMAAYYTWICYREVFIKMQRPLAMLK